MGDIVKGAILSTEHYLSFLAEQERGVQLHHAQRKETLLPETKFFHGRLHHCYTFQTAQKLRLQADDEVTYLPREDGDRIKGTVVRYNKRSGEIEIGLTSETDSTSGNIEIDFKWLVRRTLEWLRDYGSRITAAPWQCAPKHRPMTDGRCYGSLPLNERQRTSIENSLSTGFSYTWGPPGSGKTQFALAALVGELVSGTKRVLVVAPTNNALDMAMRAVLKQAGEIGVSSEEIIRLGIPTPEFLLDHSDVCEDAAVREEMVQISSEIELKSQQAKELERLKYLDKAISEQQKTVNGINSRATVIRDRTRDAGQSTEKLIAQCKDIESQIGRLVIEEAQAVRDKSRLTVIQRLLQSSARKEIEGRIAIAKANAARCREELRAANADIARVTTANDNDEQKRKRT